MVKSIVAVNPWSRRPNPVEQTKEAIIPWQLNLVNDIAVPSVALRYYVLRLVPVKSPAAARQ